MLILSADVRLGTENALSAKMRPRRATCGLRIKDGSKMTSGSQNRRSQYGTGLCFVVVKLVCKTPARSSMYMPCCRASREAF